MLENRMLEKLELKIKEFEERKKKIMDDIRTGNITGIDGIISAGKELELIRFKISTIEEAIRK